MIKDYVMHDESAIYSRLAIFEASLNMLDECIWNFQVYDSSFHFERWYRIQYDNSEYFVRFRFSRTIRSSVYAYDFVELRMFWDRNTGRAVNQWEFIDRWHDDMEYEIGHALQLIA